MKLRLFSVAAAFGAAVIAGSGGAAQELPYQIFDQYLLPLAQRSGMPGLSALVVRNGRVEWEKGYGYADVEKKVPVHPTTPFAIGGVTQAMTAVLLGICIDRHQLNVDLPIRNWVPSFSDPSATVRQVLSHSVTGQYAYDPANYAALTAVVEGCSGLPYRVDTAVELFDRLAMPLSAPGLDLVRPEGQSARDLFDQGAMIKYRSVLENVAKPYRVDSRTGNATRTEFPYFGVNAAVGLVSTARDLANFEGSLDDRDDNIPLSLSTLNQMWTPATYTDPATRQTLDLPTGLGWFVQTSSNTRLVWTFGHIPDAGSALILKMPAKRLTLILLSNSDGLARGYDLERGDITTSPFVKVFLRLFI